MGIGIMDFFFNSSKSDNNSGTVQNSVLCRHHFFCCLDLKNFLLLALAPRLEAGHSMTQSWICTAGNNDVWWWSWKCILKYFALRS